MKKLNLRNVILMVTMLVLLPISLSDCKKDEDASIIKDFYVFDVQADTEWDYWIIAKDGSNFFLEQQGAKPSSVYFKPSNNGDGFTLFFDEVGLPSKVIIQDYIVLFGNYRDKLVDVSVINPEGKISITRDVFCDLDLTLYYSKGAASQFDFLDGLKVTSHAIGIASCIAGIVLPPGINAIALIGCGATILGLVAEALPEDFEILGLTATGIGTFADGVGCFTGKLWECGVAAAQVGLTIKIADLEEIENREDDIRSAQAVLDYGYGDIQVNLTWSNDADLDIHVVDPYGEEIFWNHAYSASGGILDVDDINGFGPENIFWPKDEAPLGVYDVYVHHFEWSYEPNRPFNSDYTIIVNAFDHLETFKGSVAKDQTIHIASFDRNGIYSGSKKSFTISKGIKNSNLK